MAFLTPDKVTSVNGVTVKQFFLTEHNPNGISLPSRRVGACGGVTVHNTDIINAAKGTTMSEQYTRSTYNGNMRDVRVHYYVDGKEAWQNLPLNRQSWHAGHKGKPEAHGSEKGNQTTFSIECIMGGVKGYEQAEDNAARLAAWLLVENGLGTDKLFTHNYWENIRCGRTGSVDYLNTVPDGYKGCPVYIIPHWEDFKTKVNGYILALKAGEPLKMYYVQVGAFSVKEYAENFLKEVKEHYPKSFIKEFKGSALYYVQVGAFTILGNAEKYLAEIKTEYPDAFIKAM